MEHWPRGKDGGDSNSNGNAESSTNSSGTTTWMSMLDSGKIAVTAGGWQHF
jgi:hypothetical protein